MKRWGETFTKPPLLTLSRAERAQGPPRVYLLWDCSALKWHNEVNAYDSSVPGPASLLLSSELLQDKEALIK